jgi:hypothetical protein
MQASDFHEQNCATARFSDSPPRGENAVRHFAKNSTNPQVERVLSATEFENLICGAVCQEGRSKPPR